MNPAPISFRFARLTMLTGVFAVFVGALSATEILIDFGRSSRQTTVDDQGRQWNNVTENMAAGTNLGLVDTRNAGAGVVLTLTRAFNIGDYNLDGLPALTSLYPASATSDSLFGNVAEFGGESEVVPLVTLSGLDPNQGYELRFFASRGLTKDNRIVRYEIVGTATSNLFLETNGNTGSHVISASGIRPSAKGVITISVNHSTMNESGFPLLGSGDSDIGFAYLGVLHIKYAENP